MLKTTAFACLSFLLCLTSLSAVATESTQSIVSMSISERKAALESSVVRISGRTARGGSFSGSGTVIYVGKEGTLVLTASHVASLAKDLAIKVGNAVYITSNITLMPGTDAAWILFEERIPGVVPLGLELSPGFGIKMVIAAGYWGRSTDIGNKNEYVLTLTVGRVSRSVATKIPGPDGMLEGMLLGDVPLLAGYSGGPILTENHEIVGVNIGISSRTSIFTDIRHIWNALPEYVTKGERVQVPYTANADWWREPGIERITVSDEDTITPKGGVTMTIKDLKTLLDSASGERVTPFRAPFGADDVKKFDVGSIVVIGGKKYRVEGGAISGNARYWNRTANPAIKNEKWIGLIGKNFFAMIVVSEVPADEKIESDGPGSKVGTGPEKGQGRRK